ncbi:flap endonuclease [Halioglobus maricola]|uniref:Flap endonuclease n=2 Tax=Halioglobus maricola TaxID=2601894 RepID=A0A5P9NPX7_9GAMM|nr:flap endonuclease [Halioglobus maricola]
MPDRWYTDDGMPLNAVYGYSNFLVDFLPHLAPGDPVAAAFDESLGTCFRNEIFADYKASRELPDQALAFQLRACRTVTELAGIPCYGGARYEADDYLATLARLAAERGTAATVVTRDKDLGQLLDHPDTTWWDFAADQFLDATAFHQRFGVRPAQFADYLALVGDSVDDIPGVPGVGPKTAAALLSARETLEGIASDFAGVADLPVRGATKLADKLSAHWPQVLVSRKLAQLERHVPGVNELPSFALDRQRVQAVSDYLSELGLGGPLLRRWQRLDDRRAESSAQ